MGLYDTIKQLPFRCRKCKYQEEKHDWQTKALENALFAYGVGDNVSTPMAELRQGAIEIHTSCPKCDKLIEANVKVEGGRITNKIRYIRLRYPKGGVGKKSNFKIDRRFLRGLIRSATARKKQEEKDLYKSEYRYIANMSSKETKDTFLYFKHNRQLNLDVYEALKDEDLDYKLKPVSASPRETIVHLIKITRDYCNAIERGKLTFSTHYKNLRNMSNLSKRRLIFMLKQSTERLRNLLENEDIESKTVIVPWNSNPIKILEMLRGGLVSHEILHQGWNLAIMDGLGIKRPQSYIKMWGS